MSEPVHNATFKPEQDQYRLVLFISGMSARSISAIENLREICEQHLQGNFELEIIDVYQQRQLTVEHQIVATPTLIRFKPMPKKIILGDLSDTAKVLHILGIHPKH